LFAGWWLAGAVCSGPMGTPLVGFSSTMLTPRFVLEFE
jgi:hypothetical protein